MPDLFKEWLPSILHTKENIMKDEIDEKDYNPFMINRALSLYPDCLFFANEMNKNYGLPKRCQYDFLISSIRTKKRHFMPWPKKQNNDDIKLIMRHFNYSQPKAFQALQILSEEQIESIRKIYKDL